MHCRRKYFENIRPKVFTFYLNILKGARKKFLRSMGCLFPGKCAKWKRCDLW